MKLIKGTVLCGTHHNPACSERFHGADIPKATFEQSWLAPELAPGWKFRILILDQDLVFMTDSGATHITQDEIGNTYDRVGGSTAISNHSPDDSDKAIWRNL